MTELDHVILDLDGVVRHWDRRQFMSTAAGFGLTPDEFAAVAFESELLRAAMTGALTADAWAREVGRRVGERHGCDAEAVAVAFATLGWSIDDAVLSVVRDVRARQRAGVALFSNASTRLEQDLESCGIDREFDAVFNSARLGVAKPDPAAFRTVAASLGTVPARCLFIDDTPANIEGARAAGMHAEPFVDAASLRSTLERAGLL